MEDVTVSLAPGGLAERDDGEDPAHGGLSWGAGVWTLMGSSSEHGPTRQYEQKHTEAKL